MPVPMILNELQGRPYGVRAGLAPLLLAVIVVIHAHQTAAYENGTFLPQFRASDFLRLIKQPAAFELQWCSVEGVRTEVFVHLARVFAQERPTHRDPELLDIVRSLSVFAAQLPEYTRYNSGLPEPAKSIRDALLTAREPATLIFTSLPVACGLIPFSADEPPDTDRVQRFVDVLGNGLNDLRGTYFRLLERIRDRIAHGLADGVRPDRAGIARRASRVVVAAHAPRLQTFARCLADDALPDEAWAERVGSFILSKPPARWNVSDETRAMDDIDILAATFRRVEATAFAGTMEAPNLTAMRVMLTQGNGVERALVVRTRAEDESSLIELAAKLEAVIDGSGELGIAALARVLTMHFPGNGKLRCE